MTKNLCCSHSFCRSVTSTADHDDIWNLDVSEEQQDPISGSVPQAKQVDEDQTKSVDAWKPDPVQYPQAAMDAVQRYPSLLSRCAGQDGKSQQYPSLVSDLPAAPALRGTMHKLSAQEKQKVVAFLAVLHDKSGWKSRGLSDGTHRHERMIQGSPLKMVLGTTTLKNVSFAKIVAFFNDAERFQDCMQATDKMFLHGRIVEVIDPDRFVATATFAIPLLPSRDFVWSSLKVIMPSEKEILNICKSVERDDYPRNENSWRVVRGSIMESGYRFVDNGDGSVLCQYMVQADAGGWLPTWVLNACALDQADNVTRARKFCEKQFALGP
mmetsp:Transcript_32521/g.52315  ORF Transcript_32521/g.52315 Transcript_32521/m.52315 type:complete len:325 (-) Transcript_32521:12-986(-)